MNPLIFIPICFIIYGLKLLRDSYIIKTQGASTLTLSERLNLYIHRKNPVKHKNILDRLTSSLTLYRKMYFYFYAGLFSLVNGIISLYFLIKESL